MVSEDAIIAKVSERYLGSGDYNGLPLTELCKDEDSAESRALVRELVERGQLAIVTSSGGANPFIRQFPDRPTEKQLALMDEESDDFVCLYPTEAVLRNRPEIAAYADRPFSQRLALGEAQLTPVFFELAVLDKYRRDARFHYHFDDYTGYISIGDSAYQDNDTQERDKVTLQTFGVGKRENGLRAVVVYLRYLAGLSPEHQAIWNAYRLDEKCAIADPYVDETLGIWREEHELVGSVYQAFLEEQEIVNAMAEAMGRPPFFRETWKNNRPREFSPFMLPTQRNFNEFVHLLDKMLSDNINLDFCGTEVPRKNAEGQALGSLALLEAWLSRPAIRWGKGSGKQLVDAWREVRKLRQKPAHLIEDDAYDSALYQRQNEIMERTYLALAALRQVFSTHPAARQIEIPNWIAEARIQHY